MFPSLYVGNFKLFISAPTAEKGYCIYIRLWRDDDKQLIEETAFGTLAKCPPFEFDSLYDAKNACEEWAKLIISREWTKLQMTK